MPVQREQIRSRIADTLGTVEAVLDVGCGSCDLVRFLARRVAHEAVGIDINGHTGHEHLPGDADGSPRTARCLEMDARHMDELGDGWFDAVVSTHALHEIAEPMKALQEMRRVLKHGGTLLIADFAKGERRWKERYFTPGEVDAMLRQAGFAEIDVEKVPGEPFMFATASKLAPLNAEPSGGRQPGAR
ncbi:MAG: class I SAM-dependent methyltransferase [Armatimonadota bacterium]|nr:class I SAM-dependent methyltransferase [Armatimonadota bacterium]